MDRLVDKLNLFVVIYGADLITKNILIREVLYANNSLLLNSKIIEVKKIIIVLLLLLNKKIV